MSTFRNQIDEIKSKIKISDILSKHVKLEQRGNDKWCLCFFHKEKTASMKISDELCSYYCFGCGTKGDVFTFYTDYLNYSFNDALKELGKKTGVEIRYSSSNNNSENYKKLYEILDISSRWFENNLFIDENKKVLDYLINRKISKKTIKEFKLGYSNNSSSTLYKYLKNKSISDNDLFKIGLIKKDKNEKIRDFFYKRLIFPIHDINNKVVGFGARTLENSNPKYINSSESDLFKKGRILYNLNQAKEHSRKKRNLLVCEGFMDVIALYEHGIKSVVAPLGTSLTIEQLILLWKYCKVPTLMFDGDLAGKKASIKSALLALKNLNPNYSLNFNELSDGNDPDSYINKYSKKEFANLLKQPKDLSNFIFDHAKNSFPYNTPDQKIILDKYIDDITDQIENSKVKFFYKKEFKNKLFNFFRNYNPSKFLRKDDKLKQKINNLVNLEIFSFIATYINHESLRKDLVEDFSKLLIENDVLKKTIDVIISPDKINLPSSKFSDSILDENILEIINKALNVKIYRLFPYSSPKYSSKTAILDIKNALKIIESRLSNSIEFDKSYKVYKSESEILNWEELKNISYDIISEEQK
tara:strand:- start:976 stop:2733 length:1758 start_codon:yes stop_codon:yes gene_type:complete